MIELVGNRTEGNQKRAESAGIFIFTGRIHCKITGSHLGQELVLVVNDHLELADQLAYLVRENTQLVSGGIGDIYVQIALCDSGGGVFDLEDRQLNPPYDADQDDDRHNEDLENRRVSVQPYACGRFLGTSVFVVGDDIIKGAVQGIVEIYTFSFQDCAGFFRSALLRERH